jgi:hypothetical protein
MDVSLHFALECMHCTARHKVLFYLAQIPKTQIITPTRFHGQGFPSFFVSCLPCVENNATLPEMAGLVALERRDTPTSVDQKWPLSTTRHHYSFTFCELVSKALLRSH